MKQQPTNLSRGHAMPYALTNSIAIRFMLIFMFGLFLLGSLSAQTISFSNTNLNGESSNNPTSLDFGPDGRLYVAQQDGTIKAYTVERDNAAPGSGSYSVTATETINLIKTDVPNHNDDGATNGTNQRQVTGLLALGTAANPVLYVTSSDWRIAVGNDTGLDTNSGVISRLTWNGSQWVKVDIVRGLSRCEENHAINGLDIDLTTNTLYVMVGGNANKGAPGNNFSGTPEYWTSAALISVDLNEIDQIIANNGGQPFVDSRTNTAFVYDLPTLNDPARPNITNTSSDFPYSAGHPLFNASIDVGDPFGGNNGSNQAITEPGGPVQIHSGGYRNAYDIVFTENGRLYSSDNGPNGGWGGLPLEYDENDIFVGDLGATLDPGHYITNEFNESGSNGHGDVLHFINPDPATPTEPYYGGHPTPIRAFPKKSRIIIYEEISGTWTETANYDFEDLLVGVSGYYNPTLDISDYPDKPLEGVYTSNIMSTYGRIDIINSSTNGICEYTASNFDGAMQGNILTASFNGNINRYAMNAAGDDATTEVTGFLSGFGSQPLDVIAQGDTDPFPGTIWAATYGADNITVFEPVDFGNCPEPGDPEYDDPLVDSDNDGYDNADEVANGTNICSGGSVPNDNDGDFTSDLLDDDDDNDGILDINDPFAIDADNGMNTTLPILYPFVNNNPGTGFAGLGFTGWMINNSTDYLDQYIPDNVDFGGAAGKASIVEVSDGDAYQNDNSQDNGFQFGLNNTIDPFTVHTKLESPFFGNPNTGDSQTPVNFQSWGIQVGPGDQDNYLKVVFNANGGAGGIEVLKEENGTTTANTYGTTVVGDLLGAAAVDIYMTCFPGNNTIQPYVSINEGSTIVTLGTPIVVPASWLDPTDNQAVAIGLISTSTGASPFTAIWDFINVTAENPNANLVAENPPLDFGQVVEGSSAVSQQLRVRNEGGPSAGSVEITSVSFSGADAGEFTYTGPLPVEIGPGNVADLDIEFTPGAIGVKDANVVITHDGDNSPYSVPIAAEVLEESLVLYRVNAGGAAQTSLDGPNPGWDEDTNNNPSSYRNSGSNVASTSANNFDPSVPAYVPAAIWSQERWDPGAAPEMQWDFPAAVAGNYTVNLFLLSNCTCTDEVGERIFDVTIEGNTVLNDYDIVADVGHKTAVMKTFTVSVTDGNLDIDFGHVVENPLVNGIEILGPGSGGSPIIVEPIADQVNIEGDDVNLLISASGGTIGENFTFSAIGLPPGIQVEPTNGQISGEISAGAAANSPYNVTVTVSKPSDTPVEEEFVWTVLPPSAGTALYRVNCGGLEITDTEMSWEADQSAAAANGSAQTGTPSSYLNLSGGAEDITFGGNYTGGMLNTYPNGLFSTERYSTIAGTTDNMQWDFPVPSGTYQVNLLFAEIWSGATDPGVRVFTIEVEDQTTTDFDATDEFGHQTAGVKSYTVDVTDGNLDINFIQQLQNPAIKAIEVRSISTNQTVWIDKDEDESYTGRHECSFVQAGEHFYLFGGREMSTKLEKYDYNSDSWSVAATVPQSFNHFQAVEYQGYIWVIGAFKDNNFPSEAPAEEIYLYDPANDVWIQGPTIPANRRRGSAALVEYNGKFYVIGGNTLGHGGGDNVAEYYVPWFDEYDPATNTWTPLADAPRARDHFHAAVDGTKIYAVSGRQTGGPDGVFAPVLPEVDVYDFSTGQWSTLPAGSNLPTPRAATAVTNFEGKIFVIGGEGGGQAYKTTEALDPNTNTWESLADMNHARHGTQAIVSGDGIQILAGSPSQGGGNQKNMECYGQDNPTGTASDASDLVAPASVNFAANGSETIDLTTANGNQGIFIESMALSGADAADFSFVGGNLDKFLLPAGGVHQVEILYSGTGSNQTAILEINHSNGQTTTIDLLGPDSSTSSLTGSIGIDVCEGSNLTIWFYEAGTPTLAYQNTTALGANGAFSMTDIPAGTYDVMVKLDNSLSEMSASAHVFTGGQATTVNDFGTIRMGDCNNDNAITILDFSVLSGSFGETEGSPDYDARADFNCDTAITILDFSSLSGNFGASGDQANGL